MNTCFWMSLVTGACRSPARDLLLLAEDGVPAAGFFDGFHEDVGVVFGVDRVGLVGSFVETAFVEQFDGGFGTEDVGVSARLAAEDDGYGGFLAGIGKIVRLGRGFVHGWVGYMR